MAASSIAASLSGLKWDLRSGQSISYLVNKFTDLTGIEQVSFVASKCPIWQMVSVASLFEHLSIVYNVSQSYKMLYLTESKNVINWSLIWQH